MTNKKEVGAGCYQPRNKKFRNIEILKKCTAKISDSYNKSKFLTVKEPLLTELVEIINNYASLC